MEIMTALLILAFAFLPIIGVIGTSTKDTDVANSTVFAQTTARNILDTLLDDVPFNCIIQDNDNGNVARIMPYGKYTVEEVKSFLAMLENDQVSQETGGLAQGTIEDERKIKYKITIYVWPIKASKKDETIDVENELMFTYLPRPQYEDNAEAWYTYEKKESDAFLKQTKTTPNPYENYDKINKDIKRAFDLGARPNKATNEYCVMKKILFKMEWQSRGRIDSSSLELYTMKANLDSDGKSIGS